MAIVVREISVFLGARAIVASATSCGMHAAYTYGQRVYLTLTQGIHSGFARFRGVFAGVRGGFAGVSRGFRGVSRAFRPIRKLTNRFTWFSNPSLASQSFAKFTPLSHVSHHFRWFPKEFSPSFAAVSQPFHSRFTSLREISQL